MPLACCGGHGGAGGGIEEEGEGLGSQIRYVRDLAGDSGGEEGIAYFPEIAHPGTEEDRFAEGGGLDWGLPAGVGREAFADEYEVGGLGEGGEFPGGVADVDHDRGGRGDALGSEVDRQVGVGEGGLDLGASLSVPGDEQEAAVDAGVESGMQEGDEGGFLAGPGGGAEDDEGGGGSEQ